ncbi:Nucleotidylyl transferase [Dentipellis sp. KUC8613]|nr:Nucleotidylyl transferase [Dentipellis sp. KUC8613]
MSTDTPTQSVADTSSPITSNNTRTDMPFPPSGISRALLLATITDLDPPHFLAQAITNAAKATRDRLVIVLFSRLFNADHKTPASPASKRDSTSSTSSGPPPGVSRAGKWEEVQRLLTYVYVQATKVAQDMDKVLLEVDVLLRGLNENVSENIAQGAEVLFRIEGDCIPAPLPHSISALRTAWTAPGEHTFDHTLSSPISPNSEPESTFPVVALGGTFDHLHAGHKILLSMAAWITEQNIIVGVTDDPLLVKKANIDVLEKLPVRIRHVREFLELFKPGLEYHIVPIDDVYGPTGWDPNIQALVVSRETIAGGEAVTKRRAEKSLPALRVFVIDVISHSSARLDAEDLELLKQTKMSSTFIREWIVKKAEEGADRTAN